MNKQKSFRVSLGILVGYLLGVIINVFFFQKDIIEAFSDQRLIFLFVGALLSFFIYSKSKSNSK